MALDNLQWPGKTLVVNSLPEATTAACGQLPGACEPKEAGTYVAHSGGMPLFPDWAFPQGARSGVLLVWWKPGSIYCLVTGWDPALRTAGSAMQERLFTAGWLAPFHRLHID